MMVRGLYGKYKIPIWAGYDKKVTKDILEKAIKELTEAGYHVQAVVCDMGGNNKEGRKSLGITIEKPCFDNPFRPGCKVYFYHCTPHLVKNMRNHFLSQGFVLSTGARVGKEHLIRVREKMYSNDNELTPSSKLTDQHIAPPDEQKVSFATQLFSNTNSKCIDQLFPKDITMQELSQFFKYANDFFDIFNATEEVHKRGNPLGNAYGLDAENTEAQDEVLQYWKEEITSLRARWENKEGLKNKIQPWQEGMLMNINALKPMFDELKREYPGQIDYILTYRLNQDCLEQFFSVLRAMGGSYTKFGALEGLRRIRSYLLGAGGTLTVKAANVKPTENPDFTLDSLVEKADFTVQSVVDPDLELTDDPRDEVLITLNVAVAPDHENPPPNSDIDLEKLLDDYELSKDVCFRGAEEAEPVCRDEEVQGSVELELDSSDEDFDDEDILQDVTNILDDMGVSSQKEVIKPQEEVKKPRDYYFEDIAAEYMDQYFEKFSHDKDFKAMKVSKEQLIKDLKKMNDEFCEFHKGGLVKTKGVTKILVDKLTPMFSNYEEKFIKKFVLDRTYKKIKAVCEKYREERKAKLAENKKLKKEKSLRSKTKAMEYAQAHNFAPKTEEFDSDPDFEVTSSRKRAKGKKTTGQSVKRSKK